MSAREPRPQAQHKPGPPNPAAPSRSAASASRAGNAAALKFVARWSLKLALTGALVFGADWGKRQLFAHPAFALSRIVVSGEQKAAREEIARYLDVVPGQNIFSLNLETMRASVLRHPWIKAVSLRRVLPSTLEVEVVEHAAKAIVALQRLYLVDEGGRIFSRVSVSEAPDLPIITGLTRELYEQDESEWRRQLALGLTFADAAAKRGFVAGEIQIDPVLGVIAHFSQGAGQPPGQAAMGEGDFETKIKRLQEVRGMLAARGQAAAYFLLDNARHPEWVVARVAGPPPKPKAVPKASPKAIAEAR